MFQQDKNKAATDNQPPTTFWKKTGVFEL